MEFREVANSPFKPFQDYVSVKRAKELGFIPEEYWSVFVDRCACGSERMARLSGEKGSVTGITCCNPCCRIKLAYQLSLIFERFGYKGIGKETCAKVIQDFVEYGQPFGLSDILLHGEGIISLTGAIGIRWDEGMMCIKNSRQTLGAFLYKLSYPGLGSKFEDIMQGISTMAQLAEIIQNEGYLNFFRNRGVKSFTTIYYFTTFLPDIYKIVNAYKDCITVSLDKILSVCLTGRMWTSVGRLTKAEYLSLCNRYLEERKLTEPFELKLVESVSKATFIVAGEDSVVGQTSKYRQAVEKQAALQREKNSPDYKILFSPDEFLSLVLGKEGGNGRNG